MIDIENLEQAALAATPGEWKTYEFTSVGPTRNNQVNGGFFICHCEGSDKEPNAAFIATANPSAVLELIARLKAAEQDAALRFDSYAGVIIWIDNNRVYRKINKEHVVSEIVSGSVLTHETQRCLDEIAAMKESK